MIILDGNTEKIQVVLGAAVTTNQVRWMSSYAQLATTDLETYAGEHGVTNNTTDVDVVTGVASKQIVVKSMSFYNSDTAAVTVHVKLDVSGTERPIYSVTLDVGTSLHYEDGRGWYVSEQTYMPIKSFTVHGDAGANFAMTNATLAERFAGNTTRHLFLVDLLGYTQVRLRVNKQVIGTAGSIFRAKYYTSHNTTVGNFLQLGASAQVETSMAATGYFDSGWMDLAAGARNNSICIGFTELGGDGVADPAIGATDILFR